MMLKIIFYQKIPPIFNKKQIFLESHSVNKEKNLVNNPNLKNRVNKNMFQIITSFQKANKIFKMQLFIKISKHLHHNIKISKIMFKILLKNFKFYLRKFNKDLVKKMDQFKIEVTVKIPKVFKTNNFINYKIRRITMKKAL